MDFLDGTISQYIEELQKNNKYLSLEFDEQEAIEQEFIKGVESLTGSIEEMLQKELKGVKLSFTDDLQIGMKASLKIKDGYRGQIQCSRLLLMCEYQMFYQMNYENIVIDGKNIDNIRKMQFHLAFYGMLYHEIAHIYKGHLYLYDKWEVEQTVEKRFLDIQTLEWDADCYAASQLANVVYRMNNDILKNDNSDFALQIMIGAIHGMMFWQRQKQDFCDMDSKQHPPIFYREMAMISSLGELLGSMDKVKKYLLGYEIEFIKVFKMDKIDVERYLNDSVLNKEKLGEIEDNWNIIKVLLEQYSLFPLNDADELF